MKLASNSIITISVATQNPAKLSAIELAFKQFYNKITIIGEKVSSEVNDTPLSETETIQGAKNRLKNLKNKSATFHISIESGIQEIENITYLFTWVAIKKDNNIFMGRSISYPIPQQISAQLFKGEDLAAIAETVTNEKDLRSKGGFVSYISQNKLTRSKITKDAITCALLPFVNEEIYS